MSEVSQCDRPAPGSDAVAVDPDYPALFEDAPCGYLVTRDDGTIVTVNDTFVRWSGHGRAELVGRSFHSLLPLGDRILYSTHCMPQLGVHGAIGEIAIDIVAADGTRRAALLSGTRTAPTDGTAAQVRLIVFSAHERRLYENELLAARRRAEESEGRRARAEADLLHRVLHDPLTGLPNRAGLIERLTGLAGSGDEQLSLLFIDLDHFKTVNDSLGHAAGDELLVIVAGRLKATVRETSVIARFAGDEFVVAQTITDTAQVTALAQRLLDVLNAPVVIAGLEIVPSASIGLVVATAGEVSTETLLRDADIAMYRAKSRGRNRWEQHDPAEPDLTADRLRVLEELRHGIERGELRLHYQPRVDLQSGRLHGVEALVRWQHPTRGLLSPASFVAVAEEAGLIRSLGEWVLQHALDQAERWAGDPRVGPIGMAINLSARQLTDSRLVELVTGALARHAVDPSQVTLEITETAIMHDPDLALQALNALKGLGVCLAVDDFGTGYSSLTYLNRFPVDELKIDQSFVRGLDRTRGDTAIVSSCIQLAHAMGVHAVAEGVETVEHHRRLAELGCDLAQGYLYSPPLAAPALVAWTCRHREDLQRGDLHR